MKEGQIYEQIFFIKCSHVQGFRIWINNSNSDSADELLVSVCSFKYEKEVFSERINNFEFVGSGWVDVPFPAPIQENGGTYWASFRWLGSEKGNRLELRLRDKCREGTLTIDGELPDYDILLSYGCPITTSFSFS